MAIKKKVKLVLVAYLRELMKKKYSLEMGATQTLLSLFSDCRIKALAYLAGIRSNLPEKIYLSFGSLWHTVLEMYYKAMIKGKAPVQRQGQIKFARNAMQKSVIEYRLSNAGVSKIHQIETFVEVIAAVMFPLYCKLYGEADSEGEIIGAEDTVIIENDSLKLMLKYDLILGKVSKQSKKMNYYLVEDKTRGGIDENLITEALPYDFQTLFYMSCINLVFDNIKLAGTIYNVIKRPSLKMYDEQPTSEFANRIKENIDKNGIAYYMKRFSTPFVSDKIAEFWNTELKNKIMEFKLWVNGKLPTYRNERACRGRGNCYLIPMCSSCDLSGYKTDGNIFEELDLED